MRKKISDPYKPRKKLSRHAHESIKPCLYGTGALEVGAEKKYIDLFLEPRSLPESDGHRDHGGIGGSKNKFFFLIVFQRLMP